MSYIVTVSYPKKEGSTFNSQYYYDTHMPLVDKHWKPEGLIKWDIVAYDPKPDGSDPAYSYVAILTWKDKEAATAGMTGPHAKEIIGDIPNFSSETPEIASGQISKSN